MEPFIGYCRNSRAWYWDASIFPGIEGTAQRLVDNFSIGIYVEEHDGGHGTKGEFQIDVIDMYFDGTETLHMKIFDDSFHLLSDERFSVVFNTIDKLSPNVTADELEGILKTSGFRDITKIKL